MSGGIRIEVVIMSIMLLVGCGGEECRKIVEMKCEQGTAISGADMLIEDGGRYYATGWVGDAMRGERVERGYRVVIAPYCREKWGEGYRIEYLGYREQGEGAIRIERINREAGEEITDSGIEIEVSFLPEEPIPEGGKYTKELVIEYRVIDEAGNSCEGKGSYIEDEAHIEFYGRIRK